MHRTFVLTPAVTMLFCLLPSCKENPIQGTEAGPLDTVSVALDYQVLPITGLKLMHNITFNLLYPDSSLPDSLCPRTTAVVTPHTLLLARFLNCPINQRWQYGIEDQAMTFYAIDSSVAGSYKSVSLFFRATGPCAGAIIFAAMDPINPSLGIQRTSPGASVLYRCNPLDSIYLQMARQDWHVDTSDGFSFLKLHISGKTNAFKLKVETYGDGNPGGVSIFPDILGNFNDSLTIAFLYGLTDFAYEPGTRIAAYGGVGYPDIRQLPNPYHIQRHLTERVPPNKRLELTEGASINSGRRETSTGLETTVKPISQRTLVQTPNPIPPQLSRGR